MNGAGGGRRTGPAQGTPNEIQDLHVFLSIARGRAVPCWTGISLLWPGEIMGVLGESGLARSTTCWNRPRRLLPANGTSLVEPFILKGRIFSSQAGELTANPWRANFARFSRKVSGPHPTSAPASSSSGVRRARVSGRSALNDRIRKVFDTRVSPRDVTAFRVLSTHS